MIPSNIYLINGINRLIHGLTRLINVWGARPGPWGRRKGRVVGGLGGGGAAQISYCGKSEYFVGTEWQPFFKHHGKPDIMATHLQTHMGNHRKFIGKS